MLQPDLAWSYGIGASFAAASHGYLNDRQSVISKELIRSKPFLHLTLFLGAILFPIMIYMSYRYPSWQVMHVRWLRENQSVILPLGGAAMLFLAWSGFLVSAALFQKGYPYVGFLQFPLGYFANFIIGIFGWDGTGYQRFFSLGPQWLSEWDWSVYSQWAQSEIARDVNVATLAVTPLLLVIIVYWFRKSARHQVSSVHIASTLLVVVIVCVASAIGITVSFQSFSPTLHTLITLVLVLILFSPRRGLFFWAYRRLYWGGNG